MTRADLELLLLECDDMAARVTVLEVRLGADDPEVRALRRDISASAESFRVALRGLGAVDETPVTVH